MLQNYASHEWSNLKYDLISKKIEGEYESFNRLSNIFKFGFKWFCYSSIFLAFVLLLSGAYFLFNLKSQNQDWLYPWILVSFLSSCNFIFTPIWALLEGCNQVNYLYKFRLIQIISTNIFLWLAIYFRLGLWSTSIPIFISIITSVIFIKNNYYSFFNQLIKNNKIKIATNFKKELLQTQLKSALNSFGNYFSYSFFTPIIIKYLGSSDAGKFGITYSMISLIANFSTSILTPKLPTFAIYASQKNYSLLNTLFFKILKSTLFILILLSILFYLTININYFDQYRERFLGNNLIIIVLFAQFFQTIQISFGAYMRAYKKEEVVFITLLQSFLVLISTLFFSKYYTLDKIVYSFLAISIITSILVFYKWKKFIFIYNK